MIEQLYEPFRHWSNTGSVYIMSDPHFDDQDHLEMAPEWLKAEETLARINVVVKGGDTFVCLGDVGKPEYAKRIKAKKKILITGNHDDKPRIFKDIFDEIYTGPLFIADRILLSHEPVRGLEFCLNIHGHVHSQRDPFDDEGHYLNLAADMCDFTPVSLGKLIKQGVLSKITHIHRDTIDRAAERKSERIQNKNEG